MNERFVTAVLPSIRPGVLGMVSALATSFALLAVFPPLAQGQDAPPASASATTSATASAPATTPALRPAPTGPTATQPPASGTIAPVSAPASTDDGEMSPAMFVMLVLVVLTLAGFGAVVAVTIIVGAAVFIGGATVMSSVLISVITGRVKTGLKLLAVQLFAVVGAASGFGAMTFLNWVLELHWSWRQIFGWGASIGLVSGLVSLLLLLVVIKRLRKWFMRRMMGI